MVCLVAVMLVMVVLVAAAKVKVAVGGRGICGALCGGDVVISTVLISRQSRSTIRQIRH